MKSFKDLSIRKKLNYLLIGVSTIAVLAACFTFYVLIVDRYQQSHLDDLNSLADIIGTNCAASLAFGIPEDADQLLASLTKRPAIVQAVIHDSNGKLFIEYSSKNAQSRHNPASNEGYNQSSLLEVSQDIELNGMKIGTMILRDDMRHIRSFKKIALLIMASVVFVVLAFTAVLARRLQETISGPISNLAAIAQEISTSQDYSLYAEKESSDEVGKLVDSFNHMLSQIGQRNDDLQKSENRFRSFINQAVDAFFLHDMNGRLIDVNRRACDSLGYSREELLTMTVADIDTEVDIKQYKEKYWTRMRPDTPVTIEGRHQCKNGDISPVEARVGLLELGGEKLLMVLARDTSERLAAEEERLQLESQLHQSQKMESIGTLAGGIAHDFNNILTPIYGYVELAMLKVSEDPELTRHLEEVKKAAERAREMVKQILTFSRRDSENISPIEVHIVIKEALKLLRASIPTTIEIKQDIDSHCSQVLANPTKIHQIIMNLCTNAYHAMRETGGILGVSLIPLEVSVKDIIKNLNLKPGPYLRLEVSDTGHGIDQATQERIFEPYFTTKAKGEGTGMGLSVVHGMVKGLGGHVTVYSEPGKGTTFHIYLPAIKDSSSQMEVLSEDPISTGSERIIVVDDEETVRSVESEMLISQGYDVKAFADPCEALSYFTDHLDMFDLIITDMTMPKMTGEKFTQKILALRPDMPVILCTGFSDLINEESAKLLGIRAYVTKPVMLRTFSQTVRNVLDGVKEQDWA